MSAPEKNNHPEKKPLPDRKIQDYLEGKLSPREQWEVELWLSEEGLESDAMEGLQQIKPEETKASVQRINHRLNQQIRQNSRKKRMFYKDHKWVAIAMLIILMLALLGYIVFFLLTVK